jgi:hypothetical protein
MMRGVSSGAHRAGLRTLAGAGVWILTGCGVFVDPLSSTPGRSSAPERGVRRLETEIANLRRAYDDMMARATPAQQRRVPGIGLELSRLADRAASTKGDLQWKRGRFGEHRFKAESVATSIDYGEHDRRMRA